MEYAEAVCQTPPVVSDEPSAALLSDLGADGLIELTARIGFMNLAARSNVSLGIPAEHFADACGLDLLASRTAPAVVPAALTAPGVAERRPRRAASQAETRPALEAFLRTLETGDLQHLVDVLAPDVVALGDGGGIRQALPRPVMGCGQGRQAHGVGIATAREMGMSMELVNVNGWPALLIRLDGEIDSVLSVRVDDGLVSAIYTVRNPEKLSGMTEESSLTR